MNIHLHPIEWWTLLLILSVLLALALLPVPAHAGQVSIQPIRMPALYIPYISQGGAL